MKSLGFIKETPNIDPDSSFTASTLSEIFQILDPQNSGKIHSHSLRIFAAAILNINCEESHPTSSSFIKSTSEQPYGKFTAEGTLVVSKGQIEKIHATFKHLYYNRKSYYINRSSSKKRQSPERAVSQPRNQRHTSFIDFADELVQNRRTQQE